MAFASVLCTDGRRYGFEEALLCGWADDGGMLLPCNIPSVPRATLRAWAALSYPALCAEVLKLFVSEHDETGITHAELEALIVGAFSRFGDERVVTVRDVAASGASGNSPSIKVAELWHGPTLAFKDLGMSVLGALLNHCLDRRGKRTTLLVGTSGDTGSSAIEAVRGKAAIQLVVLYPMGGRCTTVQERQMTHPAAVEDNVHLIGVDGSSDDLDVPMEACFRDLAFKRTHSLGTINSVNIVRLLVQVVHYFYAYLQVCPDADQDVAFSIPSGAAGHLSAGALAVKMGLPSTRLLASVNANDSLHRLLSDGVLPASASAPGGRPVVTTHSPSMDICVPYNVWRLLVLSGGCGMGEDMQALQSQIGPDKHETGVLRLPSRVRDAVRGGLGVRSVAVSDEATLATIRDVYDASGGTHIIDTHTAVGVAGALRAISGTTAGLDIGDVQHVICMGCAHPAKFLPAVSLALGKPEAALREGMSAQIRTHSCVAAVSAIGVGADRPGSDGLPYGCCEVLRRGDDWEAKTRRVVETAWDPRPDPDQKAAPKSKL